MQSVAAVESRSLETGVSIVIFQKDAGLDLLYTCENVVNTLKTFSLPFEILIVDDCSNQQTFTDLELILRSESIDFTIIELKKNVGISGAIYSGALIARYKKLLAIPGTNMYDTVGYSNIINVMQKSDVALGYRTNLKKERPPVKYIASRILLLFYRIATKNNWIDDIHGLNGFNTKDILKFLPQNGKHGGQMQLLAATLNVCKNITIVSTPIKHGHKSRGSATLKDKWPSFGAIRAAIAGLVEVNKIRKTSRDT
jgi:glycosyltransferase involved in cell wall biosynthesis